MVTFLALVRATLLFSSQCVISFLLELNQSLLVTADRLFLVHRGRVESTITLYPAKGKDMAMSATTTMLASLIVDQQEMVKHFDGHLDHHSGCQEHGIF